MVSFYGWGSAASRLEPLRGGSLLFTTKYPEISGTHFTDLGRMKGWVDLGATQWFWTRNPWIGNPAPWPLGHCSIIAYNCYSTFVAKAGFFTLKNLSKKPQIFYKLKIFDKVLFTIYTLKTGMSFIDFVDTKLIQNWYKIDT